MASNDKDAHRPTPDTAASPLPGAEPFAPALTATLRSALTAKGPAYKPRTHHLTESGQPKFINRLILETSPYLLQHAHNPVNWFAWGDEAFELAKKLGRPVLLSVGYSTCHWCHVMEKESFEDEEIAAFINANYVAVKVDREERPDVDSVYMTAVNLFTGRGGWPMTVMLTPNREPFFGGTYFPPRDGVRGARMGFLTLLGKLKDAFVNDPQQVAQTAQRLSVAMQKAAEPQPASGMPGPSTLVDAAIQLDSRFDETWGGFGRAPKFPRPSVYELLLRYYRRTGDPKALHMVTLSIDKMSTGGIYDHIAGGFHRYSTDQPWLTPHFEKMLYDNAQLVCLLTELFQITRQPRFEITARETLDYIIREMTSPEGGFYSATDADSEGHEGVFFVWTTAQLEAIVGASQARVVNAFYGVTEVGNFEGKNILNRPRSTADVAKEFGLTEAKLLEQIADAKAKIYAARETREHPLLDDKIITEWNGQMISAFARGSMAFGEPEYLRRATKAADFILASMKKDGRLLRTYRLGNAKHMAVLEDYAFFITGLLDLYEASQDARWLNDAMALQNTQDEFFVDKNAGAYYATASDGEKLLIREKPTYDGAQPSGNSVSVHNLLRLAELTDDQNYRATAEQALVALSSTLDNGALAAPKLATALDFILDKPKQIIVVAPQGGNAKPLLDQIHATFLPNRILVSASEADIDDVKKLVPLVEGKKAKDGTATAYVCTARVCLKPVTTAEALEKQLARVDELAKGVPMLGK